jgi:hypothetical protein
MTPRLHFCNLGLQTDADAGPSRGLSRAQLRLSGVLLVDKLCHNLILGTGCERKSTGNIKRLERRAAAASDVCSSGR